MKYGYLSSCDLTSYNKMKQISVHSIIAFDYIFILIDAHGQVMRVTMFNNIDDICIETGQIQNCMHRKSP